MRCTLADRQRRSRHGGVCRDRAERATSTLTRIRWGSGARAFSVVPVRSPSRAQLNEWVAEATVDCYNESECTTAFYTMLEERLGLPFEAEVLGVAVMVESIDLTDDEQI